MDALLGTLKRVMRCISVGSDDAFAYVGTTTGGIQIDLMIENTTEYLPKKAGNNGKTDMGFVSINLKSPDHGFEGDMSVALKYTFINALDGKPLTQVQLTPAFQSHA